MTQHDPVISLAIYGTRISNVGWECQMNLNNPPFKDLENLGVAGFGNSMNYFTVRIDGEFTQYTLVYNPKIIRAYQALRFGALKVSISIPKGYRLAGGASPSNVLWDIHKVLEDYAFQPRLREGAPYEFKEKFPSEEKFMKVLNDYKLERVEMPHRTMSSTSQKVATLRVEENNMDSFFADVQYPEFQGFKEIAVAENCQTNDELKGLEIPRKPKYRVMVNGEDKTSESGYNYNLDYEFKFNTLGKLNSEAFEGEEVKFTVREVLEGTVKHSGKFNPNKANETITVTLPGPKEKEKQIRVVLGDCENIDIYRRITVYVRNKYVSKIKKDVDFDTKTIKLVGNEIIDPTFEVIVNPDSNFEKSKKCKFESDKLIVYAKEKEIKLNETKDRKKESNEMTIAIILEDKNDIIDNNILHEVKISCVGSQAELKIQCSFKPDEDGGYNTEILLPSYFKGPCEINVKTDKVKTDKGIIFNPQPGKEVVIHKDDTVPIGYKWRKLWPIIGWGLGILLAIFVFIWAWNAVYGEDKQDSDPDPKPDVEVTDSTDKKLAKQLIQYENRLNEENVTFDEIREMESWINGQRSQITKTKEGKDFARKVTAYLDVINIVENPGSERTFTAIKNVALKNYEQINSTHYEYLKNVWVKGRDNNGPIFLKKKDESKVDKRLNNDPKYNSFLDIPSSKEILSGAAGDTNRGGGGGHNEDPKQENIWEEGGNG